MIRVLNALKAVLSLETVEYKQMLALAAEKKEAVLKNDVQQLEVVVARETTVFNRIKQLETEREALIEKAAVLSHVPKGTMKLTDIIELVNGDLREDFIKIRDELSDVVTKLKLSNKVNKDLVKTQLQYTSFCVNLLTGSSGPLSTYSNDGEMNDERKEVTFLIDQSV